MEAYVDELLEDWAPSPRRPEPNFRELAAALSLAEKEADTSFAGQTVLAKVVEVYDGDTIRLRWWDRGLLVQWLARLHGYDAPELRPRRSSPGWVAEKEAAVRARDALSARILGRLVLARLGPFDKYGRPLVTVTLADLDSGEPVGPEINSWMVSNGHGRPYSGGKKEPFAAGDEPPGA